MPTKNLGELDIQGDLLLAGSYGTAGQVLQSNGSGVTPSWATVGNGSGGKAFSSTFYYSPPGVTGGATLTLNRLYFVPFYVPATTTFTRIAIYTTTSVGAAISRLGIYTSSVGALPANLVIEAGTVSGSGTGTKSITISQSLTAGLYWLACVGQSTAPAQRCVTSALDLVAQGTVSGGVNANPSNGYYVDSITGSLPASPTVTLQSSTTPLVYLGV